MYYIALNVLHNMNSSRMKLFREMRNYFADGSEITENKVMEIGRELALPDYITKYEYDGCMYANFIVIQDYVKRLSEKAIIDFGLYDSEAGYKLSEIPITIDIYPDYMDLKTNRVDSKNPKVWICFKIPTLKKSKLSCRYADKYGIV